VQVVNILYPARAGVNLSTPYLTSSPIFFIPRERG